MESEAGAFGADDRLERLYRRHLPSALRLGIVLTGRPESAEDLVQDAFIRLCGRLQHLRKPESFEGYLYRTMVNLVRDEWRRGQRRSRRLLELQSKVTTSEPDFEQREALWRAAMKLPPRQRAAIYFRFYEDLSEDQTATALDCSVKAVKSLTNRAFRALRQELGGFNEP